MFAEHCQGVDISSIIKSLKEILEKSTDAYYSNKTKIWNVLASVATRSEVYFSLPASFCLSFPTVIGKIACRETPKCTWHF